MKNNLYAKITNSRIFWIVISLLGSVALWLYVTTVEDAEVTTTFYGVPVSFVGEETMREANGLVITQVDNQTVTLRMTGPRTVMAKLTETNLSVTVDLVDVTRTGTISHAYTVSYPRGVNSNDITVESRNPQTITFYVDNISSKTIEVRGQQNVSVADGYSVENMTFDPATVTVRGPAEALEQVEYALVTVERENLDSTVSAAVSYALVDKNGEPVEDGSITRDTETVTFTLPVVASKEVALDVDLVDGGGATAKNVKVTIEPASITLSGDEDILSGINKLVLGTIDLSDFALNYEETYTITLPNEVKNSTGETEARVTVEVLGLETEKFTVTNIECANVTEGFIAENVTLSVEVVVRAPENTLKEISATNIRIVADLKDVGNATGKVTVPAKIYIDGYTNAGTIGDYSVVVSLTEE